jgi:hypothetical protein
MPIKSCTLPNGKQGYKWGTNGTCYPTMKQVMHQLRVAQDIKKQQKK